MKKINDCKDCKNSYAIFCSSRCQNNYMKRKRYYKNKESEAIDDGK